MGYFKTQTNNRQFSLKELTKNHKIKELRNYCNLEIIYFKHNLETIKLLIC
jgi:hypothetical protein